MPGPYPRHVGRHGTACYRVADPLAARPANPVRPRPQAKAGRHSAQLPLACRLPPPHPHSLSPSPRTLNPTRSLSPLASSPRGGVSLARDRLPPAHSHLPPCAGLPPSFPLPRHVLATLPLPSLVRSPPSLPLPPLVRSAPFSSMAATAHGPRAAARGPRGAATRGSRGAAVRLGAGGASTELAAPTRSGSGGFARSGARRRRTTRSMREEACGAPRRRIQGGRAHRWRMEGMPVLRQRIKGGGISWRRI